MVFLDASFLIAYHNSCDVHHDAAVALMEELVEGRWGSLKLLEYVLLEVATVLLIRRDLAVASRVTSLLLEAREVEFIACSEFFLQTLETFQGQASTKLSFVDAALVAAARRDQGAFIATFDEGFQDIEDISVLPVV